MNPFDYMLRARPRDRRPSLPLWWVIVLAVLVNLLETKW